MKVYYIYHVPGVKVGCTNDPGKRLRNQGYTNYQILEAYEDIYEASDREIYLQKLMGYPVDKVPYWQSVKTANKWSKEDTIRGSKKAGSSNAKKPGYMGQIGSIGANSDIHPNKTTGICKYCGVEMQKMNLGRYHNEKCKKKPSEEGS